MRKEVTRVALTEAKGGVDELLRLADALNVELESRNGRAERSGRGQFATPSQAARTMASLVEPGGGVLRVVDPGAGAGALMDRRLRQQGFGPCPTILRASPC